MERSDARPYQEGRGVAQSGEVLTAFIRLGFRCVYAGKKYDAAHIEI